MTRLLLVEDSPLVASGLRATLEPEHDLQVSAQTGTVSEAETIIRAGGIDVAIVDIRLPDGTAFDLMRRMRDVEEGPAYLIVSSFDLAQYVDAALHMGASGYILKDAPTEAILAAVRAVAEGGWAFDPDLVRKVAGAKWLSLSARDRSIIAGVRDGRSNDEIGADLDISRKTVEAHLSKLFLRFGVHSRVELVARAEREHWLEATTANGLKEL